MPTLRSTKKKQREATQPIQNPENMELLAISALKYPEHYSGEALEREMALVKPEDILEVFI